MNVNLTAQLEAFVQHKVKSGLYNSASEVVRDALRLLEQQDRLKELRLQLLREAIHKGLGSLERGEYYALNLADLKRLARERAETDGTP